MFQSRDCTFLLFTLLFSLVLSGIVSVFVSIPLTILFLWAIRSMSYEQLPKERLHKFAQLFGLSQSVDGDRAVGSEEEPLHRIVLHKGGIIEAPENTLPAIQEAAKKGAAGVEVDLQFTLDGVGILFHDDTLDRTTDATGDVRQKYYADLEGVNAAAKHKYNSTNGAVKIPTLEECVKECLRLNLLVFIDCKANADKTAELVDQLFNKYPDLYDSAVVCSFYPSIIYATRKKNPRVITALTYRKKALSCDQDCLTPRYTGMQHHLYTCLDYLTTWIVYAWAWRLCGNSFLLINKEGLCRNEVNWWKGLNVPLMAWTVNSDLEKRFCLDHLQVPIITDSVQTK